MFEHLPSLTRGLVELFEGPLRDVHFPDADLGGLTRAIDDARDARDALVRAELALQAARQCLDEQNALIARRTERSLAYARIYAAERPDLLEAVESLVRAQTSRPRGRPRKNRDGRAFTAPDATQVELLELTAEASPLTAEASPLTAEASPLTAEASPLTAETVAVHAPTRRRLAPSRAADNAAE